MAFASELKRMGYVCDTSTGVWIQPDFSGIAYSDGDEVEDRIRRIIAESSDVHSLSTELSKHCTDWPTLYHLSPSRANLFRVFDDLNNLDILEIGAGCGAITRYLGETGAQVLALEGSLRRAEITRLRTRGLDNVEVVAEEFDRWRCDRRFDVITLIGVLEYASMFLPGPHAHARMLAQVKTLLKPGGRLVVAIENQLGLKYFAGAPEDHLGKAMYGIESRYRQGQPKTFSKTALTNLLHTAGFIRTHYFAPFPDYKLPNSILDENALHDPDFDPAAFAWQSVRRDPQLPPLAHFSMELAWPTVFENKNGLDLANSFLVVASDHAIKQPDDINDTAIKQPPKKRVLAYHFSVDRYPAYCKETRFTRSPNSSQIEVLCRNLVPNAVPPLGNKIQHHIHERSDYHNGRPLSLDFIFLVASEGWTISNVARFFKTYISIVHDLTNVNANYEFLGEGHNLPGAAFDLLPQNIVRDLSGQYHWIDTEWSLDEEFDPKYLVFRAAFWSLNLLTRFGSPSDRTIVTRADFIEKLFDDLGWLVAEDDFDSFLRTEANIQEEITGRAVSTDLDLLLRAPLPFDAVTYEAFNAHATQRSLLEQERARLDRFVNVRDRFILELDQDLRTIDADRRRLQAEIEWYKADSARAESARRDMEQDFIRSTSWRLTAPLRSVVTGARKVRQLFGSGAIHGRVDGAAATILDPAQDLEGIERFAPSVPNPTGQIDVARRNDYQEWIRRYDTIDEQTRQSIREQVATWNKLPLISVVMPVYEAPLAYLDEAIQSVRNQLYPTWELCIADDASPSQEVRAVLKKHADQDHRIKVVLREENGHIAAASNSALAVAAGDFIGLLDQDDLLPEHALFCVAVEIIADDEAGLIYSDEDKIDLVGQRFDPYFKCQYNPELMLAHNMICHFGVYRRDLVEDVNGFRAGVDGSQDYDLALRIIERLTPQQIKHIPRVLYHWRAHEASTARAGSQKQYALEAGRRVVADHLARRDIAADVIEAPGIPGRNRVRFALPEKFPLVSIVIPTRDGVELLKACLNSIFSKTTYPKYEIIIVDNGSENPETLSYLQSLPTTTVRVIRQDAPFNFSSLVNAGVHKSKGDFVCLMNNDITVVTKDWIEELVSFAAQAEIGCVGARLWYPDYTLQHGGVILGIGGVAGHSHKYFPVAAPGFFGRAQLHQSLSAVTGALLMIRRSLYGQVEGFDETLDVAFNDVDFCIKVREAGYRNVWTPYAEFVHHESRSRGLDDTPDKRVRFMLEVRELQNRWAQVLREDPAYSPNLTLDYEDFSLAWPPRVPLLSALLA